MVIQEEQGGKDGGHTSVLAALCTWTHLCLVCVCGNTVKMILLELAAVDKKHYEQLSGFVDAEALLSS